MELKHVHEPLSAHELVCLLIVLNGIETRPASDNLHDYDALLIVLNGIETKIRVISNDLHVSFNRTKWN